MSQLLSEPLTSELSNVFKLKLFAMSGVLFECYNGDKDYGIESRTKLP